MRKNQGFTLIELIAVIAILAILAATAIPQFVDLRTEARTAAASGVAGSLASAAALNYARKVAGQAGYTVVTGAGACNAAMGLVTGATGYSATNGATAPADGAAGDCNVTDGTVTVPVRIIGAS